MPEARIVDDRIDLSRAAEERFPIIRRLNLIEGQVRGLRKMIEEDRYCLDEVQQINAILAGLREVALIIVDQHVTAAVNIALTQADKETVRSDAIRVLRAAMRIKN